MNDDARSTQNDSTDKRKETYIIVLNDDLCLSTNHHLDDNVSFLLKLALYENQQIAYARIN